MLNYKRIGGALIVIVLIIALAYFFFFQTSELKVRKGGVRLYDKTLEEYEMVLNISEDRFESISPSDALIRDAHETRVRINNLDSVGKTVKLFYIKDREGNFETIFEKEVAGESTLTEIIPFYDGIVYYYSCTDCLDGASNLGILMGVGNASRYLQLDYTVDGFTDNIVEYDIETKVSDTPNSGNVLFIAITNNTLNDSIFSVLSRNKDSRYPSGFIPLITGTASSKEYQIFPILVTTQGKEHTVVCESNCAGSNNKVTIKVV